MNPRQPQVEPPQNETSEAQFVVGRSTEGQWVALEEHGALGGIFVSRDACLKFVRDECARTGSVHLRMSDSPISFFGAGRC